MSNQNTKKSPGIEGALFNCTRDMRMDNFGCLNAVVHFLYSISILHEPAKKKIMAYTLTAKSPPSPIRASKLLARPPLPSSSAGIL